MVGLHPTNPIVRSRPQGACGSCLEIQCTDPRNICYPAFQPTIALVTNECNDGCNATNINVSGCQSSMLCVLELHCEQTGKHVMLGLPSRKPMPRAPPAYVLRVVCPELSLQLQQANPQAAAHAQPHPQQRLASTMHYATASLLAATWHASAVAHPR